MKRVSRLLGMGALVSVLFSGCGLLPTEEEFDAAPVVKQYEENNYSKYTVTKSDMVQTESLVVTYQGTKTVELTGDEDGTRIKKICVKKGQKVKKGALLIEKYLEDEEDEVKSDQREIATLELQIRQAKQMRKRELEQLSRTGGSAEEKKNVKAQYDAQIKNCQSNLKLTQLDLKELEESIGDATVEADFSGTVTYVDKSFQGGYANEENILVKLQGKKKNRFRCKTKYGSYLKNGQEVYVTVGGQQYKATVKKEKNNIVYFYPKTKLSLRNGASGTVDVVLQEKKDVLNVPTALVYDMGDKKVVYIEGENGVKETREITTGVQIQNQVEITSGLEENEQILTN